MAKVITILPGRKVFLRQVMTPEFYKVHGAIRDHLGVDAKIILFAEVAQDCIRKGAYAKLQAISVLYQACHMAADRSLGFPQLRGGKFDERFPCRDKVIDVCRMQAGIPAHPRHIGIDGGYHCFGA